MSNDVKTDRHLTDDQVEVLAEWLVRTGGEGFDFLDCYDGEVAAGAENVLEVNAEDITPKDRVRIDALVRRATVTVHLPHLEADPLTETEIDELAARVAETMELYDGVEATMDRITGHCKLEEHDNLLVFNRVLNLLRKRDAAKND